MPGAVNGLEAFPVFPHFHGQLWSQGCVPGPVWGGTVGSIPRNPLESVGALCWTWPTAPPGAATMNLLWGRGNCPKSATWEGWACVGWGWNCSAAAGVHPRELLGCVTLKESDPRTLAGSPERLCWSETQQVWQEVDLMEAVEFLCRSGSVSAERIPESPALGHSNHELCLLPSTAASSAWGVWGVWQGQ